MFGLIWRLFEIFHFLRLMKIFHLEWSFREASDRFGTMPIVFAILENVIPTCLSRLSAPTCSYNMLFMSLAIWNGP